MEERGFTLIELLVVIAIIAILSVVVILSLNPAELLRQSRDSSRISDVATLKSAISLYLVDVVSPNLASGTLGYGGAYFSGPISNMSNTPSTTWGIGTIASTSIVGTTTRNNNSSGWVPVNFSAISAGAPFGVLPVDPTNATSSNLVYGYVATSSLGFKLAAHMESGKYGFNGSNDVVSKDGGLSTSTYELGTNLLL